MRWGLRGGGGERGAAPRKSAPPAAAQPPAGAQRAGAASALLRRLLDDVGATDRVGVAKLLGRVLKQHAQHDPASVAD
ncbi:MAG: hypothetical protein AAFZ87_15595, partial [Planctomycetota bacterium]